MRGSRSRQTASRCLHWTADTIQPLTPDQIAAIQDKDIDFSDIPELDDNFWQEAEVKFPDLAEQVTLRVKGSVLAYFDQASGKGYQTRINQVLESYVRRKESQLSPAIKILKLTSKLRGGYQTRINREFSKATCRRAWSRTR